jgi:FkbM family methyltransferase
VNGRAVPLGARDEAGIRNDFVGVFLDDMYGLELLTQTPSKIVDVGANVGFFSMHARNLFPHARIHAYEPNMQLRSLLDGHGQSVGFDVFYEAVGPEDGMVSLDVRGESNQTRTFVGTTNLVRQVTLQRVLDRMGGSIDLLKMDCEGCEWGLLADETAIQRVRMVTMEYHCWANNSTHLDAINTLKKLGFTVVRSDPDQQWGQIVAIRTTAC